jgi:hypothetical protein
MPTYIVNLPTGADSEPRKYYVEFWGGHPQTVKIRRRFTAHGMSRMSWATIWTRVKREPPGPVAATAIRMIYDARYERRTSDAYLQPAALQRGVPTAEPTTVRNPKPELEFDTDTPPGVAFNIMIRHPKAGDPTRERFGFVATEMRWLDEHLSTDGPCEWRKINTIRRNNAADTEREARAIARNELHRLFVAPRN